MTQQDQVEFTRVPEPEDLAPPPRVLMSIVLALFTLLLLGIGAALVYLPNRGSLANLFEGGLRYALIATAVLLIGSIAARKLLPRRTLPVLLVLLVVGWVVGSAAFVFLYRTQLAPGQREVAKNVLPFMSAFDPPLPPPDAALPTPSGGDSGISADSLLSGSFSLASATPAATAAASATAPEAQVNVPTATPIPATATATLPPTATLLPTQAPTIEPVAQLPTSDPGQMMAGNPALQLPLVANLNGIEPVRQTWNNCGPANITMALSFFGYTGGQEVAQSYVRPSTEDKNVNPWELVAFVREQTNFEALTRIGGNMTLLKQFIANQIPVVVESGYLYEGSDWLGHYKTLVGYDDTRGVFLFYDSWLGPGENGSGLPISYRDFDANWAYFNRTFIAVYTAADEGIVRTILGDLADPTRAAEIAAETAQTELQDNRQNAVAWFNLGTALTRLGRYDEAATAFDQSRRQEPPLPWRMTWYQFAPFEAYFNVGRYDEVISLAEANLSNSGEYVEEMHYWQGRVLEAEGNVSGARAAFQRALIHNSRYTAAREALAALPAS
jgi:uncharacterized membrane protein (UPF0136 family)